MFRFRDPTQPPRPPKPWHAQATTCAAVAARNALLGASAAAKGTADALKWAAEGRPAQPQPESPPAPPRPAPPRPAVTPAVSTRLPTAIWVGLIVTMVLLIPQGLPWGLAVALFVVAAIAAKLAGYSARRAARQQTPPPAPPRVQPVPVVLISPPPPVMAARPPKPVPARCGKSSSKVLPILAGALLIGFVVAVSGVRSDRGRLIAPPPAPQNMGRMGATKLTEYVADNGVIGGARAALKAMEKQAQAELTKVPQAVPPVAPILPMPPLPPTPPRASSPEAAVKVALHLIPDPVAVKTQPAVRLTGVKSGSPQTTRESALNDVLLAAQVQLTERLAKIDPPLEMAPGLDQIREQYMRKESVAEVRPTPADQEAWRAAGLDTDRFWVTADFEVSEDQVRQLRGEHRLATKGPLFLFALVVAGGMYGFLRLDAWTKGHLTGVLLLVYGGVMAGAVALAALTTPW